MVVSRKVQWNPDFSNPRFFEPWHISLGFALVKHSNFIPDFLNPRFFETPDFSNQFLPPMVEIPKKFTFDISNLHKILKLLLRSFHLNGHKSQTKGTTTFYYTVNSTKESTAQYLSFEWPLIRSGFPMGAVYYVYTVILNFDSWVKS